MKRPKLQGKSVLYKPVWHFYPGTSESGGRQMTLPDSTVRKPRNGNIGPKPLTLYMRNAKTIDCPL
eukprot:scaffold278630_cov50-Prasinocladus_malaysianus.AAC.1